MCAVQREVNLEQQTVLCTVADTCLILHVVIFSGILATRCEYKAMVTSATRFKH